MKKFIKYAYRSDHGLELIFSSLRWLFLIISIYVFIVKYIEQPNELMLYLFLMLFIFGIAYMSIVEYY